LQTSERTAAAASAQSWHTSYLNVLGLEPEPPTLGFLRRLTRAHVLRIPFENLTSILRRAAAGQLEVPPLNRETELQSWAAQRGGGVCFEVVDMLGALLDALGFVQYPVLATISFAGSHQANLVTVSGAQYLVDAGNGAPLFEPIAVQDDGPALEVHHVGLSYRFRPSPEQPGALVQERFIEGEWRLFCTYDLSPATEVGRADAYRRHHTRGQSWVVDNLTLVRCTETAVWSLRDDRVTHYTDGGKETFAVASPAEYQRLVSEVFGLPNAPVSDALGALGLGS
jgi:arylamine N-acetyltransferase